MTHIDDLYEPNDREPTEPDDDEHEPVDLDAVEADYRAALAMCAAAPCAPPSAAERSAFLAIPVPRLLADLRAARERLAAWEALPTRQEYTTSLDDRPPATSPAVGETYRQQLTELADRTGRDLYARTLHVGPWQRLDKTSPF